MTTVAVLGVSCPTCHAPAGENCRHTLGTRRGEPFTSTAYHWPRRVAALAHDGGTEVTP